MLQWISTLCVPQHPSPLRLCDDEFVVVVLLSVARKLQRLHISLLDVESPLINTVRPRSNFLAELTVKLMNDGLYVWNDVGH